MATSVGVKDHAANVTAEDFCLPSVKKNSSAPSSTSKMDKEIVHEKASECDNWLSDS